MFRDEQLDEASIVDQVIRRHSALLARVVFVQVAHRPAQLLQVPDHDRIGFEVIVVVGGLQSDLLEGQEQKSFFATCSPTCLDQLKSAGL